MTKLLNAYRNAPTLKNAQKLRAYERSHPFAACLINKADADLLAEAIFHANSGVRQSLSDAIAHTNKA